MCNVLNKFTSSVFEIVNWYRSIFQDLRKWKLICRSIFCKTHARASGERERSSASPDPLTSDFYLNLAHVICWKFASVIFWDLLCISENRKNSTCRFLKILYSWVKESCVLLKGQLGRGWPRSMYGQWAGQRNRGYSPGSKLRLPIPPLACLSQPLQWGFSPHFACNPFAGLVQYDVGLILCTLTPRHAHALKGCKIKQNSSTSCF